MNARRTIQYGSLWPQGHFGRDVAQGFAEAIARGTGGRITVEVTPPSVDDDLTNDVISGKIAMTSGHAIQDHVPEFGLGYLPYLYRSYDDYTNIWSVGSPISNAIAAYIEKRQVPVVLLGYSVIGFRDTILRERRIVSAGDFTGLKMRFDGSTTAHDTQAAFGAVPQYIEYHQVKDAFRDNVIDAADNTSFNFVYMGWDQVTKNVSLTSHQLLTNLEIVNVDFWHSLSAQDQTLFRTAMGDACAKFCATAKVKREQALGELSQTYGLAVNPITPDVRAELEAKVEPLRQTFVQEHGLEKEYRAVLAAQQPSGTDIPGP
jgi:TRAP-type C4-dicarboxylate transport system substrate-binding protein